jgi:hypothetical protein
MDGTDIITYHYKFIFDDGTQMEFRVELDGKNLNLIETENKPHPEWTELNFFKCPNCSLDGEKHKFCPVAINLTELVDSFRDSISYKEVDVTVETEARKYKKHTSLQKGLSSLIGIYMVTSGCPVMDKLKPMVRFHLPFATVEETKYRAISMYLLAQYFKYKQGLEPDWALKHLVRIYADIRTVNRAFCKRLSNIKVEDAGINALTILDCFADSILFSINKDMLDEIGLLFSAYLRDEQGRGV